MRAIPTALADSLINQNHLRGIRQFAALATPSQFGGTALHIDNRGDTIDIFQLFLDIYDGAAMINFGIFCPCDTAWERFWLIGHNRNIAHAFGGKLGGYHPWRLAATDSLTTGHGNRAIIENLEGDIDPRGNRSADAKIAGMGIGTITHILKTMRMAGKWRAANPEGTLAAHLRIVGDGVRC